MLNITVAQEGALATIVLEGTLNAMTAPDFAAKVNELPEETREAVVEMKDLKYTSSAGLRVMISLQKRMSKCKGTVVYKNVNDTIKETLEDTGLDELLTIE